MRFCYLRYFGHLQYAKKMEGLAGVRDGSEDKIGLSYWLCDVTAVNDEGTEIVPAYSELFSHTAEVTSENQKILNAVAEVMPWSPSDATAVFDRGGDREELLTPLLTADRQVTVRQRGTRHLFYEGEIRSFDFLTRKTKLRWTFTVERIQKNKIRKLTFA